MLIIIESVVGHGMRQREPAIENEELKSSVHMKCIETHI